MTPQLAMTGPLVIPLAPLPVRRHAWFFLLPRLPLALFVARGSQTQNTKTRSPLLCCRAHQSASPASEKSGVLRRRRLLQPLPAGRCTLVGTEVP